VKLISKLKQTARQESGETLFPFATNASEQASRQHRVTTKQLILLSFDVVVVVVALALVPEPIFQFLRNQQTSTELGSPQEA